MSQRDVILKDALQLDEEDRVYLAKELLKNVEHEGDELTRLRGLMKNPRLEAMLLEGLEGEPRELTDHDWDEMRRQFDERNPQVAP